MVRPGLHLAVQVDGQSKEGRRNACLQAADHKYRMHGRCCGRWMWSPAGVPVPRCSCHLVQWPVPGLLGGGRLWHVTCTAVMLLSLCSCWRICDFAAGLVCAGSACDAPCCLLRAQHSPADLGLLRALQPFCTAPCTEALPVARPSTFVYLQMEA